MSQEEYALAILLAVVVFPFWPWSIFLGIRIAKLKGISPHWMWFGIHPVLGWIAFIAIALIERVECSTCGNLASVKKKVCPVCRTPFVSNHRRTRCLRDRKTR